MMKRHFDVESDGFYGAYWKCKTGSDCAMIAMIGDDPEDYLARTSVKWLHKLGDDNVTWKKGLWTFGTGRNKTKIKLENYKVGGQRGYRQNNTRFKPLFCMARSVHTISTK